MHPIRPVAMNTTRLTTYVAMDRVYCIFMWWERIGETRQKAFTRQVRCHATIGIEGMLRCQGLCWDVGAW